MKISDEGWAAMRDFSLKCRLARMSVGKKLFYYFLGIGCVLFTWGIVIYAIMSCIFYSIHHHFLKGVLIIFGVVCLILVIGGVTVTIQEWLLDKVYDEDI